MLPSETPNAPPAFVPVSAPVSAPAEPLKWDFASNIQSLYQRDLNSGLKPRRLGVTWDHLTVKGIRADATVKKNVISQLAGLTRLLCRPKQQKLQTILENSHGCVRPGEMLLVLGRPGSGCTTLLKMLSNRRAGYHSIEGDIWFGSMDHKEAEVFRDQIVMNMEEEIFYPALSVSETMAFAVRSKLSSQRPDDVPSNEHPHTEILGFLLQSLQIEHTADTKVGKDYIRAVSSGERKCVSILECLASRGSIYCWDNSTRGLDASNALDWAKAIRTMTDVYGFCTIVTLHQAGNPIYNLFDKVLVLDEGKEVYYGPKDNAKPFMESLGFHCEDGANIADFLTGVTVPTGLRMRPGCEIFPRDADSILTHYRYSDIYLDMIAEYRYPSTKICYKYTKDFQESIAMENSNN